MNYCGDHHDKISLDDGHDVVIYESLDYYGGQWVYVDDDHMGTHSSCYKNMVAATPKKTMEYSHFPMGDKYPNVRAILFFGFVSSFFSQKFGFLFFFGGFVFCVNVSSFARGVKF